jgi:rhodanese-related sulfurtransferase
VALQLIRKGFSRVYALEGGFAAWADAGFPMEEK